ncbi:hypothetical protein TNCV_5060591 [Trichonephila clavipes]|nr:hypothetical protein TNCV_5060591 [Trichonephila clavipes]
MGNLAYAENADMHYVYVHANRNSKVPLLMYHTQFPDHRMLDHRICQPLHLQLCGTGWFHVTRHDVGR